MAQGNDGILLAYHVSLVWIIATAGSTKIMDKRQLHIHRTLACGGKRGEPIRIGGHYSQSLVVNG